MTVKRRCFCVLFFYFQRRRAMNEKKKQSKKRIKWKPDISKQELREMMGEFDQVFERRHGAYRRKGR